MGIGLIDLPARYQDQVAKAIYCAATLPAPPATSKRNRRNKESGIQKSLVRWFRFAHLGLGVADERLLVAVPNGGYRRPLEAAILVGEGVRKGFPDLVLFAARGVHHALGIELKTEDGVVSKEQTEMRRVLSTAGYPVVVARSFDEARERVEAYCKLCSEPEFPSPYPEAVK